MGDVINRYVEQLQEVAITEDTLKAAKSARCLISLDDSPVTEDKILSNNSLIRSTCGVYYIGFNDGKTRIGKYKGFKYKPFFIICDLFACPLRVNGPEHFRELANVFPEIAWLLRNTNYNDELFRLAREHLGIQFNFNLDFVAYEKMLKEKGAKDRVFYSTQDYNELVFGELVKPGKKEYHNEFILSNKLAWEHAGGR